MKAEYQIFADHYLTNGGKGKQAAIQSGYAESNAASTACEIMGREDVKQYISSKLKAASDKADTSLERVLSEYAKVAFSDIRNYYTENGSLKNPKDLDDREAAALAGIETFEEYNHEDKQKVLVSFTKKIKTYDKIKALDSICRVLGYNAPEKQDPPKDNSALMKLLSELNFEQLYQLKYGVKP